MSGHIPAAGLAPAERAKRRGGLPAPAGPPREEMLRGLEEVRGKLGGPGAAERAADAVLELLPAPVKV